MSLYYKKTLSPAFWKNGNFDQKIRQKLLKIVKDFLKEFDNKLDVKCVRLTGSLANYTYNKYSDLDVHIVVDFSKINKDKDLVKEALDGKRFIWNLRHNIYLNGHEVELYFEDVNEPHISTGVYCLCSGKWIKEPKYDPPTDIDVSLVKNRVLNSADLINRMYDYLQKTEDKKEAKLIHNKAKRIKDKIVKVRKDALADKGEFAVENLVFKKLRNAGLIEKLIEIINQSYDKFFMEKLNFNNVVVDLIK